MISWLYLSNRGTFEDGRVNLAKDGKNQCTIQQNSDTHLYDVGANVQMAAPLQVK